MECSPDPTHYGPTVSVDYGTWWSAPYTERFSPPPAQHIHTRWSAPVQKALEGSPPHPTPGAAPTTRHSPPPWPGHPIRELCDSALFSQGLVSLIQPLKEGSGDLEGRKEKKPKKEGERHLWDGQVKDWKTIKVLPPPDQAPCRIV